jgi:hypothetical protein
MLDEDLIIKDDRTPSYSNLSGSQERKPKKKRDSTYVRVNCSKGSKAHLRKHLLTALVEQKSMTMILNENLKIQDASNKALCMLGSGESTLRNKFDAHSSTGQLHGQSEFIQQACILQHRLLAHKADQEGLESPTNKSFKK